MTLNEIKDEYLSYEKKRLANVNFISHKSVMNKYICPIIGNKDVKYIENSDIILILEYRMSFKHTVLSISAFYQIIRDIFKYLVSKGYLDTDLTKNHVFYSRISGNINYDYE